MTTTHTPGPWGMYPDEWTNHATAIIAAPDAGPQNRVIAYVGDTEDEGDTAGADYRDMDETDKANARLMAAAPDLLAACLRAKPYLASLPGKYGQESADLLAQLKAAIAKAEGK